jgi:2'-5' RNA ligase
MRIKTDFVLMVDPQVHNFARKLAMDIHYQYNTGLIAARLPQHITLGPGFETDFVELERVADYLEGLAKKTQPFTIKFHHISLKIVPDDREGLGIIWMDVQESKTLQKLHEKIYSDIKAYGWKVDWAPGVKYLFHSTISYGGLPGNKYQEIYRALPEKDIDLSSRIAQIAMCCPPDEHNTPGTFITYKIFSLGAA